MLGSRYKSLFIFFCGLISACTSMQINHSMPVAVSSQEKVFVAPFNNLTETPQAEERAAAITANLLRARGMQNVVLYRNPNTRTLLIPTLTSSMTSREIVQMARKLNADTIICGSVSEWTYKVGLDGEPVVGVTINLVDAQSGQVKWSAVGSRSGGSRAALSAEGQKLIRDMLNTITVR